MDTQDTLTIAEVSQGLRAGRTTLWRWRQRGIGPRWIKTGTSIRYPRADYEAYLRGQDESGDVGQAAENSGQHSVSPAPDPGMGESGSRARLDRPAAYNDQVAS